jgi:hypothetical protein
MRELADVIAVFRRLLNAGIESASQLLDAAFRLQIVRERLFRHNQLEETRIYSWIDTILGEEERSADRAI